MPSFGGERPPKLDENEQEELLELLREGQPGKSQEIQHLLKEEFDVEYHPDYLGTFFRKLKLSYAKPRLKQPYRPENPEEILNERVDRFAARCSETKVFIGNIVRRVARLRYPCTL